MLPIRGPHGDIHLPEHRRMELLQLAARAAASSGLSESDAQFVELLGSGLGFDADAVMDVVLEAMGNPGASAA